MPFFFFFFLGGFENIKYRNPDLESIKNIYSICAGTSHCYFSENIKYRNPDFDYKTSD